MAYSELVKNFNRVRGYLRDFYVYGFKTRDEFSIDKKSKRTYDDERRRIESWLSDYMCFRTNADGKTVFLSIDPRSIQHNPLYKTWKTKSFTDIDITLHFILLDILISEKEPISLKAILQKIDEYLCVFKKPKVFDESTVRKKLKEYIEEGIVQSENSRKIVLYKIAPLFDFDNPTTKELNVDLLNFFSEVAPCGVVGSFLLDKTEVKNQNELQNPFYFKHHYITSAMDSEVLYNIFSALRQKRKIQVEVISKKDGNPRHNILTPLQVFISVQSGRQYLLAYYEKQSHIASFRLDNFVSVQIEDVDENFEKKRADLENMKSNMWGVNTDNTSDTRIEHIEFTVYFSDKEQFILNRLNREKRCGKVTLLDANHAKFEADVFNSGELIPWIRTFICRITDIQFSNKTLEEQFKTDLYRMFRLYEV